jgi:hypothetical protein
MDRHDGRDFGPPGGLIALGFAGPLLEAAGRWLGGRWGGTLTQVGAGAVSGGALVFFSRLAVWLWARKRQ